MKLLRDIQDRLQAKDNLDDKMYTLVLEEVERGMVMKDLWARASAHGDFDANRTRALYIRERVSRLNRHRRDIGEYLNRMAAEQARSDAERVIQHQYQAEQSQHERRLSELMQAKDELAHRITKEAYQLGQRKKAAIADTQGEAEIIAKKKAKQERQIFIAGGVIGLFAALAAVLQLHIGILVVLGMLTMIVLSSVFMLGDSPEQLMESAALEVERASPLESLRKEHQAVVDQIVHVRQQSPARPTHIEGPDPQQLSALEAKIKPLFDLEPLKT